MRAVTDEGVIEGDLKTTELNSALFRLTNQIDIAKQVGYDTSNLEALKNTLNPDTFNSSSFNAALGAEYSKMASTPGGQSYARAGQLRNLSRFEGDFDWRNAPYADQIIKEFGQETPYTASMAMFLAQNYGVSSLRDLDFNSKLVPGYTDYNLTDGAGNPTVVPDSYEPVVKVKSTGQVIPNQFASYDNGGTNKDGGATFRFSWALNPDGTPTIKTDANPRAGGFINDFVKPILPYAALLIPGFGQAIGGSLLAGTALAGNALVATALGNAVANLSIQALSGNVKNASDVLKIFAAAGISAGVAQAANLITPEGPPTPGGYTTDAGRLVDSLSGGAISGKLADVVGGAVQGGLTGLATNNDPVRTAILGGTARLSGVVGQSIATSTGSQAIGNAVATALNTAVAAGRLDDAISKGGIAGLNTFLNETLASTAREQNLTPDQTRLLKVGGSLALQTIVSGSPNPQQAINTIVSTLKNDYDANGQQWKIKTPVAPTATSPSPLNVADNDGNIDIGTLYFKSFPSTLEGLTQFASANAGTISDVAVNMPALQRVIVTASSSGENKSFFESLYESAKDALGINGPSDVTAADIGQKLFESLVSAANSAQKNDPTSPIGDIFRSVTYNVLAGSVDSLGAINTLNGVLKVVGLTSDGGVLDKFHDRVKVLSDALTPPGTKAQEAALSKEWEKVTDTKGLLNFLATAPFNYPGAVLKKVISEGGEEVIQAVTTGGLAAGAKALSFGIKAGSAIGRKADFAYEVVESTGAAANDAAQKRTEVLAKDLASGKITKEQFDKEVEIARGKGALAGLVIGSVVGKVPDLPKVTDAATTSMLNKVVANTLVATVNLTGKEGLPAAAVEALTSYAAGKEINGFDLVKTGALEMALGKLTSTSITGGGKIVSGATAGIGKARDVGANIYNSFQGTGIDANNTLATAGADVRALMKSGSNFETLTSKINDSVSAGGVMPEVSDLVAKVYVNGAVDKVIYDALKQNNVPEDKIDSIISGVTDSVLQGVGSDALISKFSQELAKNGVDLKAADSAQTDLFGTSQEKKQAQQYDKLVADLIGQGSSVSAAQRSAQNQLGLTPAWLEWNKTTNPLGPTSVVASIDSSKASADVSTSKASAEASTPKAAVDASISASTSQSIETKNSIVASVSESTANKASADASTSVSISQSTADKISAAKASADASTSVSISQSVETKNSIVASVSESTANKASADASTSVSISQSTADKVSAAKASADVSTALASISASAAQSSADKASIESSVSQASISKASADQASASISYSTQQSIDLSNTLASIATSASQSSSLKASTEASVSQSSADRAASIKASVDASISTSSASVSASTSLAIASATKASADKASADASTAASVSQSAADKASATKASVDASISQSISTKASTELSISQSASTKVSVDASINASFSTSAEKASAKASSDASISASTSKAAADASVAASTSKAAVDASIAASTSKAAADASTAASTSKAAADASISASTSKSVADASVAASTSKAAVDASVAASTSKAAADASISASTSKAAADASAAASTSKAAADTSTSKAAADASTSASTSKAAADASTSASTSKAAADASTSKIAADASALYASAKLSVENSISFSQSASTSQSTAASISASQSVAASVSSSKVNASAVVDISTSVSQMMASVAASEQASIEKSNSDRFASLAASISTIASTSQAAADASAAKVSQIKASVDASIAQASVDKASVEKASADKVSVIKASVDASIAQASIDKASVDKASVERASVVKASVDASISQSAKASADASVSQSTKASVENSISQSAKASIENSVSQSTKASIDNSVSQSTKASTEASVSQSNKASVENSVSQSTKTSVENSISQSAKASVENSISQSAKASVEISVSQSNKASVESSVSQSNKASVENSVSQSINESIENSVSQSTKSSVENSVSQSTKESIENSISQSNKASIETSVSPSIETSASPSIETSVSPSVEASISPSVEASVSPSAETSVSPSVETSVSLSVETSVSPSVSVCVDVTPPPLVTSSQPPVSSSLPVSSSPPVSSSVPPVSSSAPPVSSSVPPVSSSVPPVSSSVPPESSPPVTTPKVTVTVTAKKTGGFQFSVPQIAALAGAEVVTSFLDTKPVVISGEPQYKGILDQFFAKVNKPLVSPNESTEAVMPKQQYYEYGEAPSIDDILGNQQETSEFEEFAFAKGGLADPFKKLYKSGKMRTDFRQGDAVSGPGDGQSDDIPAMLADGEFVFPADVVAALGNGSTKAGSEQLYKMMHNIRARARKAAPKQLPPKALSPLEYLKRRK